MGYTLAIGCALTWSLSVVLFKKTGDDLNPILLNLVKNTLGLLLMIPTVYLVEGTLVTSMPLRDLAVLVVSGLLGIGFADAMVLKALKDIGASRMAVVECVYSPFVVLLSVCFLGETLTMPRVLGGAMVVGALVLVSAPSGEATARLRPSGFLWGIGGLLSMATGIVMVKPLFATVPLFFVIGIRMAAGVVASLGVFALVPDKRAQIDLLRGVKQPGLMLFACVLSTYVSMMLWIAGYKFNDAGLAAVLNQTSTIFTVLLASLFLHERMSPSKWSATALALVGVMAMTLL